MAVRNVLLSICKRFATICTKEHLRSWIDGKGLLKMCSVEARLGSVVANKVKTMFPYSYYPNNVKALIVVSVDKTVRPYNQSGGLRYYLS